MSKRHLQATIPYIIDRVLQLEREEKSQDYVTIGGSPVSHSDAVDELRRMINEGKRLVPCCSNVNEAGECQGVIED